MKLRTACSARSSSAIGFDATRECLTLVVDTSLSGQRVARELDALIDLRGRPLMVVSDNGTELTSRAILQWQEDQGVEWHYIAPRQTHAERLRRELERSLPRRVPQRAHVPQAQGDQEVRIMGSKSELLRTLVAASSGQSAAFGVHSSVLKWRADQIETANTYVVEIALG